ncbi:hypothetical protein KGA66_28775 [Actinocrinis puniceicyclus]|uniref:Uncharacterized protein n=1 Tax=Actinocrinis puniceicyclus TaxID=977794 RepID=A0A8J7WV65_9ACTN|nr:hypothetical protein [Actinocrinis puniceicyclus]MBS2967062.1 hypothetical protein [Actinocrinis puniceicyclus]
MTRTAIGQLLQVIEQREHHLAEQAGALAARLREVQAEREELQVTAKTVRAMAADLDLDRPPAPALPDGPAYQQIMGVFDHEQRPLRARDLCLALDLPVLPKHTEGTRAKLKRLVSLGFLEESEPGLFQQPRTQGQPTPNRPAALINTKEQIGPELAYRPLTLRHHRKCDRADSLTDPIKKELKARQVRGSRASKEKKTPKTSSGGSNNFSSDIRTGLEWALGAIAIVAVVAVVVYFASVVATAVALFVGIGALFEW